MVALEKLKIFTKGSTFVTFRLNRQLRPHRMCYQLDRRWRRC
jgi:hypothetical protein